MKWPRPVPPAPPCVRIGDFLLDNGVSNGAPPFTAGATFSNVTGIVSGFNNTYSLNPGRDRPCRRQPTLGEAWKPGVEDPRGEVLRYLPGGPGHAPSAGPRRRVRSPSPPVVGASQYPFDMAIALWAAMKWQFGGAWLLSLAVSTLRRWGQSQAVPVRATSRLPRTVAKIYCGQCASRGGCGWCGDASDGSQGRCVQKDDASCASPATWSTTPGSLPRAACACRIGQTTQPAGQQSGLARKTELAPPTMSVCGRPWPAPSRSPASPTTCWMASCRSSCGAASRGRRGRSIRRCASKRRFKRRCKKAEHRRTWRRPIITASGHAAELAAHGVALQHAAAGRPRAVASHADGAEARRFRRRSARSICGGITCWAAWI